MTNLKCLSKDVLTIDGKILVWHLLNNVCDEMSSLVRAEHFGRKVLVLKRRF